MITGRVTAAREVVIPLSVRVPGNRQVDLDAVVDTGFNDELSLDPEMIASLGLPYYMDSQVGLAGGVSVVLRVFRASVIWNGQPRAVSVCEMDGAPLVGMGLLWGCRIMIHAVVDGDVMIALV